MRASKALLLAASSLRSAAAFAPPRTGIVTNDPRNGVGHVVDVVAFPADAARVRSYSPPTALSAAGPPVISNWRLKGNSIVGTVTNHPTIPDGNAITTSPVKDPEGVNTNAVVQTRSGSRYKLANVAYGAKIPAVEARKRKEREAQAKAAAAAAEAKKKAADEAREAKAAASKKSNQPRAAPQKAKPAAVEKTPAAAPTTQPEANIPQLQKLAKSTFGLTGTTVGPNGKYLLAGRPRQSSGRAAKIWTAYVSDPDVPGVPLGYAPDGDESAVTEIAVKLSPDVQRLSLENGNYDRVQSGLFMGRFVKKMDYVRSVSSSDRRLDGKASLLAIESGRYDLKALLAARNGRPLAGRALRDAAASAGQCIQAVHSSNLVWTDLKTENFVVVKGGDSFDREVADDGGSLGLTGVKGIDLESVVVRGGNPIDYSPEACPPEFARAFMDGVGDEFVLEYSYDIWSLGMMIYELATGRPYFSNQNPTAVTKALCDPAFEVDVGAVPDKNLRDLIGKCLSIDPRKRPDITGFLLHPYFITTGFGPFSF